MIEFLFTSGVQLSTGTSQKTIGHHLLKGPINKLAPGLGLGKVDNDKPPDVLQAFIQ